MTTYYWIGGGGTLRQGMGGAHLSLSSGGSAVSGTVTWTASDDLIVDASSGTAGMRIDVGTTVLPMRNLDCSNAPSMSFAGSPLGFHGDAILSANVSFVIGCWFQGVNQSLTIGGAQTFKTMVIACSGTLSLLDGLTISASNGGFSHKSGAINTNGHNISCGFVAPASTPDPARSINLGASTVTLTGTQLNVWNVEGMASLDATSATLILTGAPNANGIDFKGAGFDYGIVEFQNSSGSVRIAGANNFTSLSLGGQATYSLVNAQAADTLSANAGAHRLGIQSSVGGTQQMLTAQAVSTLNNVDFKDIDAEGPAIPWSGTGLGDLGNNTNITF